MKTQLKATIALLGQLFFSCSKIVYTNQQVFNRYKTRQNVSDKFGVPYEQITTTTTEAWLYNFEEGGGNAATKNVTQFRKLNQFVIFTFDLQGNVINRQSKGVDLAERKPATGATIGLIAGGVALIVIIIAASSMHFNPDIKF